MYHRYYKLVIEVGKPHPVAVPSDDWDSCETLRRIGRHWVGALRVSTVFLSLNHAYDKNSKPYIFETMVFSALTYGEIWGRRCSTYEEALALHRRGVLWAVLSWRHQLVSAWELAVAFSKAFWATKKLTRKQIHFIQKTSAFAKIYGAKKR